MLHRLARTTRSARTRVIVRRLLIASLVVLGACTTSPTAPVQQNRAGNGYVPGPDDGSLFHF